MRQRETIDQQHVVNESCRLIVRIDDERQCLEVSLDQASIYIEGFQLRSNSNWVYPWSLVGKGGASLQLTSVQACRIFAEVMRYRGGSFGVAINEPKERFLFEIREGRDEAWMEGVEFTVQPNKREKPPIGNVPTESTVGQSSMGEEVRQAIVETAQASIASKLVRLADLKARFFRLADDILLWQDIRCQPRGYRCQRVGTMSETRGFEPQDGAYYLDIPADQLVQPMSVSWIPCEV